jgi:hypothetical protein
MSVSNSYSISVPLSAEELEEILYEDKSFEWVFPTNENENINITIHIHHGE